MMQVADMAIEVDGRILVSGMSFTVDRGDILAVAGASGIGKSLMAAALMGMLPHPAKRGGTVAFHGEALSDERLRAMRGRHIGLAPQPLSSLDPSARIGNQMRWAARRAGLPAVACRSAAAAALARFDLPERIMWLYPHHLSGGMARRVLLGIATIGQPQLLVVDEPTNGLDPASVDNVKADIRRLAADGCAVILITHDLVFAAEIADRIAVLSADGFAAPMPASAFTLDGSAIPDAQARRLWRATPANGMSIDA